MFIHKIRQITQIISYAYMYYCTQYHYTNMYAYSII
nr:MAG TPA: hypothetical protein [Caudoviricetes sp.]